MKTSMFQLKPVAFQLKPVGCKPGGLNFEQFHKAIHRGEYKTWIAEEKFDGLRYLYQIYPSGAAHHFLTSRRISKITGLYVEKQDKVPFMRNYKWPIHLTGTVFDGEFVSEGISSDTQHSMAIGEGEYRVWDILYFRCKDMRNKSLAERRALLWVLQKDFPAWMSLVPYSHKPLRLLAAIMAKGGEGLILKDPMSSYAEREWIKVKDEKHYDCVIIGYEISASDKYSKHGWIKNVVLGQYVSEFKIRKLKPQPEKWTAIAQIDGVKHFLVSVGKTSGMTEEVRADITKNQGKYLMRSVEIEAQLRLPSGKFRHPRFVRFRDDKNSYDCLIS